MKRLLKVNAPKLLNDKLRLDNDITCVLN